MNTLNNLTWALALKLLCIHHFTSTKQCYCKQSSDALFVMCLHCTLKSILFLHMLTYSKHRSISQFHVCCALRPNSVQEDRKSLKTKTQTQIMTFALHTVMFPILGSRQLDVGVLVLERVCQQRYSICDDSATHKNKKKSLLYCH